MTNIKESKNITGHRKLKLAYLFPLNISLPPGAGVFFCLRIDVYSLVCSLELKVFTLHCKIHVSENIVGLILISFSFSISHSKEM